MNLLIKQHIPNLLTVTRLLFSPIIFYFYYLLFSDLSNKSLLFWVVLVMFVGFCLTDYLDGVLARKWKVITSFGQTFDPIADKVLILGLIIILLFYGHIFWWIAIPMVLRDLAMDCGRLYFWFSKSNKKIPAIFLGKLKTVFQMIGLFISIVFYQTLEPNSYSQILNLIFGFAMFSSIWSFIIYIKKYATN